MHSPDRADVSPRDINKRSRKKPKGLDSIKKLENPGNLKPIIKTLMLSTDRRSRGELRENRNMMKPFPSADKREKLPKKIEIPDEKFDESFGFDKEEDREIIANILSLRVRVRGDKEITLLQKAFNNIKFFAEIQTELDDISYNRIFQNLTLESYEPGKKIVDYDDFGRKFYIIIKGSVYILIKNGGVIVNENLDAHENIDLKKKREKLSDVLLSNSPEEIKKATVEKYYPGFWIVRTMVEGESFGEIALSKNSDGRRTATVICKEKCTFGILTCDVYQNILGNLYERKYREKIDFLSHIDFFSHWNEKQISSLIINMQEIKLKRKTVIFKEGDSSDYIFFIFKGEVELQKYVDKETVAEKPIFQLSNRSKSIINIKTKQVKIQEPVKLGILTEKGCFGESELFSLKPREYSAIVHSSEVTLLMITREHFMSLVKDEKSLRRIHEHITNKVTQREERTLKFSSRNVSLELGDISPIGDNSPKTKNSKQTFQDFLNSKHTTPIPSPTAHLPVLETNRSIGPWEDPSFVITSPLLEKSRSTNKLKTHPTILQMSPSLSNSPSKGSSIPFSEKETNPKKLTFSRQLVLNKTSKKSSGQSYTDRQKWIEQTRQAETENENQLVKLMLNEIQENHESLNFVKKGIPLTQISKTESLGCSIPNKLPEKRKSYSQVWIDQFEKIRDLEKSEDKVNKTNKKPAKTLQSLNFDIEIPKFVPSSIPKTTKYKTANEAFSPKNHADFKAVIKKPDLFKEKDFLHFPKSSIGEKESLASVRSLTNTRISPKVQSLISSYRQIHESIQKHFKN